MRIRADESGAAAVGPQGLAGWRPTVARRQRQQLEAVWTELETELRRLALALGHDVADADDVLQDVYLTALEKCPPGLDAVDLRRWLFRVATNRCHLQHRRTKGWRGLLRAVLRLPRARSVVDSAVVELGEERQLVRSALDGLEPALKSILVLRYYSQLNSKEIGRILEISDSTVRSRLRTARQRLAQALERNGDEDV